MNTREEILQVMKEEEEGGKTYTNIVTADTFSLTFIPQIENSNAIFAS